MMFRKSIIFFSAGIVLLVVLNACRQTIYYAPSYIRYKAEQAELDSIRRLDAARAKFLADSTKKQIRIDTLLARKKAKQEKIDERKRKRELKKIARKRKQQARIKKKKVDAVPTTDSVAPPSTMVSTEKKKADTVVKPDSVKSTITPSPTTKKKTITPPTEKKFQLSPDAIKDFISQNASDYATVDEEGNIKLVGNTGNLFKDMNLSADTIVYNYIDKMMIAIPEKDSLKSLVKKINFNQGHKLFRMDGMLYNPITKKAVFENVQTKEGELYIHAAKVRQDNDSVFFGQDAVFTTCNYFPPHFSFKTNKYKMVKERTIVTGSLYPFVEEAPLLPPKVFIVPFAIFPMPKQRNSGLIFPTVQWTGIQGFGITNGGYYFVPSPYFDIKVVGSYFALGQTNVGVSSSFNKKYLMSGNASVDYLYNRTGTPKDANFTEQQSFKVNSTFNLDRAVNPTISLSANVNIVSDAKYNTYAAQSTNSDRLQNAFNSSINFSKRFKKGFIESITASGTLGQNTSAKKTDISFPNIRLQTIMINPIYYFFSNQKNLGTKWYDKLQLNYSIDFKNNVALKEGEPITNLIDNTVWGANQSFPLTLALPKLGPIVISPNINYSQELVDRETEYVWRSEVRKVDTILRKGIYPRHSFSVGASVNFDDLIATLQLPNSRLKALRHVIRFSTGISYTPDIRASEFQEFQSDTLGKKVRINRFNGSPYTKQESGKVNFNLNNIIQAKWMKKTKKNDTAFSYEEKKVDLINLGLSTAYDLIADSFNLANIAMTYTTRISDKFTFSGGGTFDPYLYVKGIRTKTLLWERGLLGFDNLLNFSLSFNYRLQGGTASSSNKPSTNTPPNHPNNMRSEYPGERQDIIDQTNRLREQFPSQYIDFSIPWSLDMGVSMNYNRGAYDKNTDKFNDNFTASVRLTGDVKLTEKWKLTANGMFDVVAGELRNIEFGLSRDLHCWTLTISIVPVGPYKTFSFVIQPRSRILQDLKIEQRRLLY